MLKYDFGEMRTEEGTNLLLRINEISTNYTFCIFKNLKNSLPYKILAEKIPSNRVDLYFTYTVRKVIYPFIRKAAVIQWYKRNGRPIADRDNVVILPKYGIFRELEKCWDLRDVPLVSVNTVSLKAIRDAECRMILRRALLGNLKRCIGGVIKKIDKIKKSGITPQNTKTQTVACNYSEGVEFLKRNDLHWFAESGIEPEKVLIYIDEPSPKTRRPIEREIIRKIEKLNFRWVALKRGVVENQGSNYWQAPDLPGSGLLKKSTARTLSEKWIVKTGNDLLREIHFWRSFYNEFNIKVNYIPGEGFARFIVQAIAFDLDRENGGFLVGKQRSDFLVPNRYSIGRHPKHPKHIFFTWSKRSERYMKPNNNLLEHLVVVGYQKCVFQKNNELNDNVRRNGAKFVITLFDSGHGKNTEYPTKKMADYYKAFLSWAINDETIGLVVKPKKPRSFNSLPGEILKLFDRAERTGRCAKMKHSWGRFPAQASYGTDMAVGIGSSSALIEALSNGCKGVFYDITNLKNHEFYKWGYGSLVFDDLNKMVTAIKNYKDNPKDDLSLGDWSPYIGELDPFRDGRGGERMGVYIRWLLESFCGGKTRGGAVRHANRLYKEKWGKDKVIKMRAENEFCENF